MTDAATLNYRRIGVIDIGSNSVRFVIYELFGAAFSPVYNEKILAGLGRELSTNGRLNPTGKTETLAALKRFQAIAKAQNLDTVLIGATAAMREATDAPEFINQIHAETGLKIRPISGKEEAYLTGQGLLSAEPRAHGIAADLGGASLELIKIKTGEVSNGFSFPIGPFHIAGNNLKSASEFDTQNMRDIILEILSNSPVKFPSNQNLYLIGGAWRNLATIHQKRCLYPMKTLQAYELMPGAAQDLANWGISDGRTHLLSWPAINQRRAETLPYSALLLDILIGWLNPTKIIISATGLREGLVHDFLPDNLKKRDALLDGCRDLARGNLQELNFAQPLFDFIQPLSTLIPKVFDTNDENRLRMAACHLAGIGKGFHPDYQADLVFEDVLYAPLAGLTHKERAYLALILFHSYTGRQRTTNQNAINLLLTTSERHSALIFGTAIRLAIVASGRSMILLQKLSIHQENGQLSIQAEPGWENVLTERVIHRLKKLGQLIGQKVTHQLH